MRRNGIRALGRPFSAFEAAGETATSTFGIRCVVFLSPDRTGAGAPPRLSYNTQVKIACLRKRTDGVRNVLTILPNAHFRDVKTANVMLTKPDEVKLGDFGVARLVKSQLATTQIGTPAFMAPEAWKGQPYDFSTDAFGLGCIMYEMVTFAVPFRGRTMNELRREIVMGRYQPLSRSSCSQALSSTISALLHPDAKKRLTPSSFLSSKPALERIHLLPNWEDFPKDDTAGVLETILVPRNLRYLQERLPWPKYPDDVEGCPPPSHGDSPCEMGFGNEKENHVDPMGVSNAQARKVVQAGRAEAAQGPPLAMPDNQLVKLGGRRNAEGNGNSELNDHPVQDAYERKRPQRDEMIKPLGRPTPCSPRPPFAVEEDLFERR